MERYSDEAVQPYTVLAASLFKYHNAIKSLWKNFTHWHQNVKQGPVADPGFADTFFCYSFNGI